LPNAWYQLKSTWQLVRHLLAVAIDNAESIVLWKKVLQRSEPRSPASDQDARRAATLSIAEAEMRDFWPNLQRIDEVTQQRFMAELEQTVNGLLTGNLVQIPGPGTEEVEQLNLDECHLLFSPEVVANRSAIADFGHRMCATEKAYRDEIVAILVRLGFDATEQLWIKSVLHLFASEYGWTPSVVGKLTVRQIINYLSEIERSRLNAPERPRSGSTPPSLAAIAPTTSISPFLHASMEDLGRLPPADMPEPYLWIMHGWNPALVPDNQLLPAKGPDFALDDLITLLQAFSVDVSPLLAQAEAHERAGSIEASFHRCQFSVEISNARRRLLRVPGIPQIRAFCQRQYGDDLTVENARKIRGMLGDGSMTVANAGDAVTKILNPPPVNISTSPVTRNCPSADAIAAYRLSIVVGGTRTALAGQLSERLGRPITQGQVSKWLKLVKEWVEAGGILPALEPATRKKPIAMDPGKIELGPRKDGRTERQRDRSDDK
jgi:hypothetical protein